MKTIRITLGALVTVCAMGVLAAPALAFTEFFASEAGAVKGRAVSEEEVFKFGPVTELNDKFTIKCFTARSTGGEVPAGVFASFAVPVKFGKCTSEGKPVKFLHQGEEPLEFEYTFFEEEGKWYTEATAGSVEIKLPADKCILTLEGGSLERAPVSIENVTAEPKGKSRFEKHSLIVKSALKGLEYSVRSSVTSEKAPKGVCGEEAGAENGSYAGALKYELSSKEGDLEALG